MDQNKLPINIINIPFTTLYSEELLDLIKEHLKPSTSPLFIATPNPEIILKSLSDSKYQQIIQNTDINIPDGNGIIWANHFNNSVKKYHNKALISLIGVLSIFKYLLQPKNKAKRFHQTIHGSDLFKQICLDKEISQHKIFLLGNKEGIKPNVSELAAQKLQILNPQINIAGFYDSIPIDLKIIEKINVSQAEIVFIAFGAPDQEIWIHYHLHELPTVRIIMGIGGSFDFLTGIIPRAPKIIRKIGLEWVFRLSQQPFKRIRRIYNAFIVFPYQVIKHRINHKQD